MAKQLVQEDPEWQRYRETLQAACRFTGLLMCTEHGLRQKNKFIGSVSLKLLAAELVCYLDQGGRLSRVKEEREDWRDCWKYHFDLWPTLGETKVYIETRFVDEPERNEGLIYIVDVHWP